MALTAQQAISRSISHDEIVHIEGADAATCHELKDLADDMAETDIGAEYWGERDGNEWRVHVDYPADADEEDTDMQASEIKVGQRVTAGMGEDADAGAVLAIGPGERSDGLPLEDGSAEVAWDSGVRTPVRIADLHAE